MTHETFVALSYGISALAIGGMIGWILIDQAGRRRDLAALEKAGVRRRSSDGKALDD
jgi:heme exporter protein D